MSIYDAKIDFKLERHRRSFASDPALTDPRLLAIAKAIGKGLARGPVSANLSHSSNGQISEYASRPDSDFAVVANDQINPNRT